MTLGSARIVSPVSLEPVKASTSCGPEVRRADRRRSPTSSESAPSGSTFASTRISTMRCATSADDGRGLVSTGMPGEQRDGRLLGQAPGREVEGVDVDRDARGAAPGRAGRGSAGCGRAGCPRRRRGPSTSPELLAELGVGGERDDRAVDVELRVARVLPPLAMARSISSSRCAWSASRDRAQQRAALARRSARAAPGRPVRAREVEAPRAGRAPRCARRPAAPRWPGSTSVCERPCPVDPAAAAGSSRRVRRSLTA